MAECHSGPWSQLDSGSWVRDRSGLPAHTASGIPLGPREPQYPQARGRPGKVGRRSGLPPRGRHRPAATGSRAAVVPVLPAQPPLSRRSPRCPGAPCPRLSEQGGGLSLQTLKAPRGPWPTLKGWCLLIHPGPTPTRTHVHTHTHTCTRQHTRNIPAVCTRGIPCLSVFFLLLVGKGPRARPALCAALALRLGPAGGVRSWAAQARGPQGAWCRRGCRLTRALLCSQG